MRAVRALIVLLAAMSSATGCGDGTRGGGGPAAPTDPSAVALTFLAEIDGEPFACGRSFAGVGTSAATVEPADLRFYVSDVRLVGEDGAETPLLLDQDGTWQLEDLALLDFEDGSGRCSFAGSREVNTSIRGTAPPGAWAGVRFTVGVPFARNHGDAATAPPPLDATALFWNWNAGYKFFVFDSWAQASGNEFRVHVGSTRCEGDGRGHVSGCGNPNRIPVEIAPLDPREDAVVVELAALLVATDVERNAPETPPGCMGAPADPDCAGPFAQLGLPFAGRPAAAQRVFGAGPGRA
ncbi:MAG: MbnP family copper-binding protein, partial [Thermodesulfobacteriota bacterium]